MTRHLPLLLALVSPSALAQVAEQVQSPELDAQRYRPPFDSRKTLWTESSGVIQSDFAGSGRLFLNYANQPLVWQDPITGDLTKIVSDVMTLNVLGSASYDRFRIGVDIPIHLLAAGDDGIGANGGAGTGDIALEGRVTGLDRRSSPLGLSASGRLYLPTATVDAALGMGAGELAGELMLLGDVEIDAVYLAANLGTRFSPTVQLSNIDVGNQFIWRAAGAYTFDGYDAGVSLDLNANINYAQARRSANSRAVGFPLESLVGGWYRLTDTDWVLRGGAGSGLTPGIGSPVARVVLSVAYERELDGDKDGDTILDSVDACVDEPEDFDEFEDENGCPDTDNDGDGIADVDDKCPNKAEDFDNFQDKNGCPDPSHLVTFKVVNGRGEEVPAATLQITGTEEAAGAHGLEAELHEGDYEVVANAPNFETATMSFKVGKAKEVLVELSAIPGTFIVLARDPNGKPIKGATYTLDGVKGPVLEDGEVETEEPSGQHTLVVRAEDFAPYKHDVFIEPNDITEVVAILQPTKVKLTRDKIEIKDKVFFDTGKSTIKPVSFALLNEVAQIIQDYPEIVKVRIEGHTDARGSETDNQKLSEARADSVKKYLEEQGVNPETLNSVGYGESKPLVEGATRAAYDKNRRVEFFVEEWDADRAPER